MKIKYRILSHTRLILFFGMILARVFTINHSKFYYIYNNYNWTIWTIWTKFKVFLDQT